MLYKDVNVLSFHSRKNRIRGFPDADEHVPFQRVAEPVLRRALAPPRAMKRFYVLTFGHSTATTADVRTASLAVALKSRHVAEPSRVVSFTYTSPPGMTPLKACFGLTFADVADDAEPQLVYIYIYRSA